MRPSGTNLSHSRPKSRPASPRLSKMGEANGRQARAKSSRSTAMPQPAVLTSWKQIAACLGCGVRTAQRWEECLALPVHRPKGKDRYVVLAFTDELEAWLRRTPVRQKENAGNIEIAGIAPALHPLLEELNVVLEQVADLVGRQLYEEAGAAIDCGRRIVRELISAISQRASA